VGVDELQVEHRAALELPLEPLLGDTFQRRQVAADLHGHHALGHAPAGVGQHLAQVFRVSEVDEAALHDGVERQHRGAAFAGGVQRAHQAGVVGGGVLAHHQDAIRGLEVIQLRRALAHADLVLQRQARRLVAEVAAVGQVAAAIGAGQQLPQEGGLVAAAAAGVEAHALGGQGLHRIGGQGQGLVPTDRHVAILRGIEAQRLGQPAGGFEVAVAPAAQLVQGVLREEGGVGAPRRHLPSDGLLALLAAVGAEGTGPVGEGAARAVKALGLVRFEEAANDLEGDALLAEGVEGGFDGATATGWGVIDGGQ
jgi:hypothetical protein